MLGYNKPFDLEDLPYPMFGSVKFDGIRCLVKDGVGLSRKLLPIPNKFVQEWIAERPYLNGMDGELIVGPPYAPDAYRRTMSGVMSIEGEPDFTFFVFDKWNSLSAFSVRMHDYLFECMTEDEPRLQTVKQVVLENADAVRAYEEKVVGNGYEGVILRSGAAFYKFGRSTLKEMALLKLKQFEDFEVTVEEIHEAMKNDNEATTDELGHTKRSHAAAGRTEGKGYVGSMTGLMDDGTRFKIGTFKGLSIPDKTQIWEEREKYLGQRAKIKAMAYGSKLAPRHGVFLGWRHAID